MNATAVSYVIDVVCADFRIPGLAPSNGDEGAYPRTSS